MSNANDFVIENGVLKKYTGKDENVAIPEGVTVIGGSAFKSCKKLTSVTIPDSVTEIGDSVFSECTNLTSITIPATTSVDRCAFSGCPNLKKHIKRSAD